MGFAAGNPRLINALTRMKSYLDYGAFTPIQVAAAAALNGPQDCVDQIRALYRERRDVLIRGLASAGWDVPARRARCSPGRRSRRSSAISAASSSPSCCWRGPRSRWRPGLGFGEHGEGYVRIALVENNHRLRQAVRSIRGFLQATTSARPKPDNGGRAAHDPATLCRGRRPGHRRRRRPEAAARQCRHRRRPGRTADRGRRRLGARPQPRPRRAAVRPALVRRPGGARRRSRRSTWWSS